MKYNTINKGKKKNNKNADNKILYKALLEV